MHCAEACSHLPHFPQALMAHLPVMVSIPKTALCSVSPRPQACSHSPLSSLALMAELHEMTSIYMLLHARWPSSQSQAKPLPPDNVAARACPAAVLLAPPLVSPAK